MAAIVTHPEPPLTESSGAESDSEHAVDLYRLVFDALAHGVVVVDADCRITLINPVALQMFGPDADAATLEHTSDITAVAVVDEDGRVLAADQRPAAKALRTGETVRNRVLGVDRPGEHRVWMSVDAAVVDSAAAGRSVILTLTDITAQRTSLDNLTHRALHDPLTGLPNRAHIIDTLSAGLRAPLHARVMAVCYIDLHGLKIINDRLGHQTGDRVLQATAQRLRAALRDQDTVGRLGGDEFVALLRGPAGSADVGRIAELMHAAISAPLTVDDTPHRISASIGVTLVAISDTRSATDILHDADGAMYRAKAAGNSRTHIT